MAGQGQRQGGQIEEVKDRWIAQQQCIGAQKRVFGLHLIDLRRQQRHGRHEQRIQLCQARVQRRHQRRAGLLQAHITGRVQRLAAADAAEHERVITLRLASYPVAVDPRRLGGDQSAVLLQTRRLRQQIIQRLIAHLGTGACKLSQRPLNCQQHLRLNLAEQQATRHTKPQRAHMAPRQWPAAAARQHAVTGSGVGHAAAQRTQRVQRVRQRKSPFTANTRLGRLEADQPVQCCRNAHRTPGV